MTVSATASAPIVSIVENGGADSSKQMELVEDGRIEAQVADDDSRTEAHSRDTATVIPTNTPPLDAVATPVANRIVEDSDVADGAASSTEESIVSKAMVSPDLETEVSLPTLEDQPEKSDCGRPLINSLLTPREACGQKRKTSSDPRFCDETAPLVAGNGSDDGSKSVTHDSIRDNALNPESTKRNVDVFSVAGNVTKNAKHRMESIIHLAPGRKRGRAMGKQIALRELSGSPVRRTARVGRPPIKYTDAPDTDESDSTTSSQTKTEASAPKATEAPRRRGRPPKPKTVEGDNNSNSGESSQVDAATENTRRRGKTIVNGSKEDEIVEDGKTGDAKDAPEAVLGKRASGKRVRRLYNPNGWSTSILTVRSKVLCLGMSYPCPQSQIRAARLNRKVQLLHPHASVEQAVELVRRNILTEMDGRDLARCLALEANNDILAYCVSLESGSIYSRRHLKANFNRKSFVQEMRQAWGKVRFRQIILDYFWIPRGSWVMTHWKRSFFDTTLVGFVQEGLLDFGPSHNADQQSAEGDAENTENVDEMPVDECGVVYLPFCLHCIQEVVTAMPVLCKYYRVSFLLKSQLAEHSLWRATSTIDPDSMQAWLGKALNQEDTYCTFKPQEVHHSALDSYVSKEDVVRVLRGIEDFEDVRMIKLKALRKFDPCGDRKTCDAEDEEAAKLKKKKNNFKCVGEDDGGFVGLKDPEEVERGYDQVGRVAEKSVAGKKECKRSITPDNCEKQRAAAAVGRVSKSVASPEKMPAHKTAKKAIPSSPTRPKVGRPAKKPSEPNESFPKEAIEDKTAAQHKKNQPTGKKTSTGKPAKSKESEKGKSAKEYSRESASMERSKEKQAKKSFKEKQEKPAKRRRTVRKAVTSDSEPEEEFLVDSHPLFIRREMRSCIKDYPLPTYEMTSHEREAIYVLLEMQEVVQTDDEEKLRSATSEVASNRPAISDVRITGSKAPQCYKNRRPASGGCSAGVADSVQKQEGAAVQSSIGVSKCGLVGSKDAKSSHPAQTRNREETVIQTESSKKAGEVLSPTTSSPVKNESDSSLSVDSLVPPSTRGNETAPHSSSPKVSILESPAAVLSCSNSVNCDADKSREETDAGAHGSSRVSAAQNELGPNVTIMPLVSSAHNHSLQGAKGTSSSGSGSTTLIDARAPCPAVRNNVPQQSTQRLISKPPSILAKSSSPPRRKNRGVDLQENSTLTARATVPSTSSTKMHHNDGHLLSGNARMESSFDRKAQESKHTLHGDNAMDHAVLSTSGASPRFSFSNMSQNEDRGLNHVKSPCGDGSLASAPSRARGTCHVWNLSQAPSRQMALVANGATVQPSISIRQNQGAVTVPGAGVKSPSANGFHLPGRVYAPVPNHGWLQSPPHRTQLPPLTTPNTTATTAEVFGNREHMGISHPPVVPHSGWDAEVPHTWRVPASFNSSPCDPTLNHAGKVNDGIVRWGVDGCLRSAQNGSGAYKNDCVPQPDPRRGAGPMDRISNDAVRKESDGIGPAPGPKGESSSGESCHSRFLVETALENFKHRRHPQPEGALPPIPILAPTYTMAQSASIYGGPQTAASRETLGGYSNWLRRKKKRPKYEA